MNNQNNRIAGFHIKGKDGDSLILYPKKYIWRIPRVLRKHNIQKGDIVAVGNKRLPVLVVDVFSEDIANTEIFRKNIVGVIERINEGKEELNG